VTRRVDPRDGTFYPDAVKDSFPELIPPDDPRFRGSDSLDDDEPYFDPVQASEHLRGAEWRWSVWKEKPAINYDADTGEGSPAVWDHDHCHFCYETAFSERYDTDLREGWLNWSPIEAREPMEQSAKYPVGLVREGQPMYDTWVCPDCFERLRRHFECAVSAPDETPE
jgi:hypothetical protein